MIKRKVCLLGATGSIGTNALKVLREYLDQFEVVGLACGASYELLAEQVLEFQPSAVSVSSAEVAESLRKRLAKTAFSEMRIHTGVEGHEQLVRETQPDVVLAAMTGVFGLQATLASLDMGVPILGIANKEVLVMAGGEIRKRLGTSKTKLIPVDSEHSAIFQALMGNRREELKKVYLTSSGGPFRTWPKERFALIGKKEALQHPTWSMGQKITIDSATMMNKGLEFIEAVHLFDLKPQEIEIVIQPQSLIHSMVEYQDRSIMAQLGISDMRIPIALALSYPKRLRLDLDEELDFSKLGSLDFEAADKDKFECLRLAEQALQAGDAACVVLNASNDIAVQQFLDERIAFIEIPQWIQQALKLFKNSQVCSLDDIIALDKEVRERMIVEMKSTALQEQHA